MRVVVVPDSPMVAALGALPPSFELAPLGAGAEPDDRHRSAEAVVLGFEIAHLAPQLGEMPALRLVQTLNAGVEWLVPLVPAGVTLCNASGVHDIPVAEWVVGVILASRRLLPRHLDAQRRGRWDPDANALAGDPDAIEADDLEGARVLVVGHGSIGRAVAARLAPFGAEVVGVARTARPGVHGPEALASLVPTADVVVLMAPLTDETRGMVDASFLAAMRDGALLVNGARGALVDQGALLAELQRGRLRAALDVTDPEPLPDGHPLWSAPNVIVTPHVAGSSRKWMGRAWRFAGDQLRRHAAGEPLANIRSGY